jgi:hypothetical protein
MEGESKPLVLWIRHADTGVSPPFGDLGHPRSASLNARDAEPTGLRAPRSVPSYSRAATWPQA